MELFLVLVLVLKQPVEGAWNTAVGAWRAAMEVMAPGEEEEATLLPPDYYVGGNQPSSGSEAGQIGWPGPGREAEPQGGRSGHHPYQRPWPWPGRRPVDGLDDIIE